MAEEINNDSADLDLESEKKPRMDQRVEKALSEKAKAEELAVKESKAREKAEREMEAAKKDVDFFKNFSTLSSKYQAASEYQDQIREKVMAGYDLEDATISILAKEGKYQPVVQQQTAAPKISPAGGSAATTLKSMADKPIGEMTQEERRKALEDSLQIT